jgi:hypothetical protein
MGTYTLIWRVNIIGHCSLGWARCGHLEAQKCATRRQGDPSLQKAKLYTAPLDNAYLAYLVVPAAQ